MSKPQKGNPSEMLKASSHQDISASVKEMSSSKQKLFPDPGSEPCLRKTTPSPQPPAKHRRSRDSVMTSSQESLSGNVSGKEGNVSSSAEKEESELITDRLTPAPDTIEEGEEEDNYHTATFTISSDPPAASLGGDGGGSNTPSQQESPDTTGDSSFLATSGSIGTSGTPTSADVSLDLPDYVPSTDRPDSAPPYADRERRQTREKSFERSLDNIMDKCSEKSLDLSLTVDSLNGTSVSDPNGLMRSNDGSTYSASSKCSRGEKKKKSAWYTMLNPTYKSRSEDFKKLFKDIPNDERLIVDYSCALQKDILVQGRMYITQNWVCFYANIFRWETVLAIPCKEITAVTKEKTARVIPNAIQIASEREKYFFTSFGARDKTFMMLFRIWQNALLHEPMSPKELWQWIHYSYGEELGLTSEDEDYVPPPGMEDLNQRLQSEDLLLAKGSEDLDLLDDVGDEEDENGDEEMPCVEEEDEDEDAFEMSISDEPCRTPPMMEATSSVTRNDIPTDLSDTTEESEGEVTCVGHDHLEKQYLDEVFNMPVEKMFELLFTNSTCLRNFVTSKKTFDINFPAWTDERDENGNRVRNLSYTLTLNHSIGPKTSPSTEKQILHKESQPSLFYVLDAECCNNGIPYADAFYVMNRYCLTRVSKSTCRLRVTSEARYRKSVMGIVKSMIEKSVVSGLTDYFRSLSAHLRKESERLEAMARPLQPAGSKKKLRRRRKVADSATPTTHRQKDLQKSSAARQASAPPSPSRASSQGHKDEASRRMQADVLVRIICFILILLVMFNAVLFYKLWSLESYANALYFPHSDAIIEDFGKQPRSQEEWMQLLKQQRLLYENEMEKWHDILSISVKLVDQMRETLVQLLSGLENRGSMPKSGYSQS